MKGEAMWVGETSTSALVLGACARRRESDDGPAGGGERVRARARTVSKRSNASSNASVACKICGGSAGICLCVRMAGGVSDNDVPSGFGFGGDAETGRGDDDKGARSAMEWEFFLLELVFTLEAELTLEAEGLRFWFWLGCVQSSTCSM